MEVPLDGSGGEGLLLVFLYPQGEVLPLPLAAPCNAANDHRTITIEVASDTTEPYAVNDTAYSATIDLVTDICKRNGISKLVWSTDKNTRVNHLNGCNMTVHRDYANKSCPGTYLYNRMGEIVAAGVSIGHKKKQCEFIVKELAGYSSVLKTLKNAASVKETSDAVLTGYEKPADQSDSIKTKRAGYGQTYYDKYAENTSGGTSAEISADSLPVVPFTVEVIISDLNYRDQPSMSGAVKGGRQAKAHSSSPRSATAGAS